MHKTRILSVAVVALLTFTVGSCSEQSPTAPAVAVTPAPTDDAQLLGILTRPVQRLGLLTCRPMAAARASATIGSAGGTIVVGPHRLVIPAGALRRPVTITAYAPSDDVNRVEFQPHGLTFAVPAHLSMSYANCDLLGSLLPKRIAYIDGDLDILYYLLSVDDLLRRRVSTRLDHFSEYAIAW
jgi:hypothetical protein